MSWKWEYAFGAEETARTAPAGFPVVQNSPHPNAVGTTEGVMALTNRTTVEIDESLHARMRHEAARGGMTVSEWIRQAITAHLLDGKQEGEAVRRRVFRSAGAGDSGGSDISERMEELRAGLTKGRDLLAEEEDTHSDG